MTWYKKYKFAEIETNIEEIENDHKMENVKTIDQIGIQEAYDKFKSSYEKSTGKSWEYQKFVNRASNWQFFGDQNGYIAVRPQRSGLLKLVSVAGNEDEPIKKAMSLFKAFSELEAQAKPTWGMVSGNIKSILERKGFKSPPPMVIKSLYRIIPPSVIGGATIKGVNPAGSLNIEYDDIGEIEKYFVANSLYYRWLADQIKTRNDVPKSVKWVLIKALGRL